MELKSWFKTSSPNYREIANTAMWNQQKKKCKKALKDKRAQSYLRKLGVLK